MSPNLAGNASEEFGACLCAEMFFAVAGGPGLGSAGPPGPGVGGHGPVGAVCAAECSYPVDFPLGVGWGRVGGSLWVLFWFFFSSKKEKEMNLSSCVADSVVLSFDSAGQTLGSGTNPSPSILSALSPWPHWKWSLVRWRGVSGEGKGISQNGGKVFRSFSGDLWSRKWNATSGRLG